MKLKYYFWLLYLLKACSKSSASKFISIIDNRNGYLLILGIVLISQSVLGQDDDGWSHRIGGSVNNAIYQAAEIRNNNSLAYAGVSVNRVEGTNEVFFWFLSELEDEVDRLMVKFEENNFSYFFIADEVMIEDGQQAIFPNFDKTYKYLPEEQRNQHIPANQAMMLFLSELLNRKGDFFVRFHTIEGETLDCIVSLKNSREALKSIFTEDFIEILDSYSF